MGEPCLAERLVDRAAAVDAARDRRAGCSAAPVSARSTASMTSSRLMVARRARESIAAARPRRDRDQPRLGEVAHDARQEAVRDRHRARRCRRRSRIRPAATGEGQHRPDGVVAASGQLQSHRVPSISGSPATPGVPARPGPSSRCRAIQTGADSTERGRHVSGRERTAMTIDALRRKPKRSRAASAATRRTAIARHRRGRRQHRRLPVMRPAARPGASRCPDCGHA